MTQKPVIYQIFTRLMTNRNATCRPGGTLAENGSGKFNDYTPEIIASLRDLGATHLWLTGIIEHAQATDYTAAGIAPADNPYIVKGLAGSPYAIKDYYDVDPDLAENPETRMAEFEALVERIHDAGLKVIIDFVPNHTARCYHSDVRPADAPDDFGADDNTGYFFSPDNNYYYLPGYGFAPTIPLGEGDRAYTEFPAKASGNDCFNASPGVNDWYETVKLNYGIDPSWGGSCHFYPIPSTWHKMAHILKYWASKGVDGFRCDMAHMVPVEFWQWVIPQVKAAGRPGLVFIAELYDTGIYHDYIHRGGFDYLYDKVNLYDTLRAVTSTGLTASAITGCWQRVEGLQDNLLNFLENHDEQRLASPQFAGDASRGIAPLAVGALMSRGPYMIYFGQELGEPGADSEGFSGPDGRTTIFDYWSLDTMRRWLASGRPSLLRLNARERQLRRDYAAILRLCNSEPAITEGAFYDLMWVNSRSDRFNPDRQYAFLRHQPGGATVLVVANFDNLDVNVDVNIPAHAFDFLAIRPGRRTAREILTGRSNEIDLSPDTPVTVDIPAGGAAVLVIDPPRKRGPRPGSKRAKKTA